MQPRLADVALLFQFKIDMILKNLEYLMNVQGFFVQMIYKLQLRI